MQLEVLMNPWREGASSGAAPRPDARVRDFHRQMPGYAPSALIDAPEVAAAVGVGRVWIKAELERFGLPAFKILGASWAAERLLEGRSDVTLVTATDGNHGRGVARVARLRGLAAHILVPAGTAQARIDG